MRTQALLLLLLTFLFFSTVSLTHRTTAQRVVGGYQPIRNGDDPNIVEIGKFAVAEHNRQAGQALVFLRVLSGQQKVVAGTNYKLAIQVAIAGVREVYEAVVNERPWENARTLISFTRLS